MRRIRKENVIKILVVGLVLLAIPVIIFMSSNSINPSSNNNGVVYEDQTVQSLRFNNANISNNTLEVMVQNTSSTNYSLKSITVKFLDGSNNTIVSINGYIGDLIKPNEFRKLSVKTDVDISNTQRLTYVINK